MSPVSNQAARLYGTATTHKFEQPQDITKKNINFHPIIYQTGTYTFNANQVVSNYLRPL